MTTASRALLVDFGSTFTKLRVVDLERGDLLAAVQTPSTVETSVMDGLHKGIDAISRQLGGADVSGYLKLASSSAAGGLRIVAIGLVRDLTAEAAHRAGLGAGGKVVGSFSNGLTSSDMAEISKLAPDLIILAGGTDGGNTACIIDNARRLAAASIQCPIVVAGNRNARDEVAALLTAGRVSFEVVENVLPRVDRIEVQGCSDAIRNVFMARIVKSKGLADAERFLGRILMPTPHAVLLGFDLLARGAGGRAGLGQIVAVDIGGATTDVYSIADGAPMGQRTAVRGLPEPVVKRTVEGDLGLRINATSIVESGGSAFRHGIKSGMDVGAHAAHLTANTGFLPDSDATREIDLALARAAVAIALRRHAGTVEIAYGPEGPFSIQFGKDLRGVRSLIGTGGVFTANPSAAGELLSDGLYDKVDPSHLLPDRPKCFVDTKYIMYAVGLLSTVAPEIALQLALDSVRPVPDGVRQ